MIKGFCEDYDIQDLIDISSTTCKITYAKRLNRRVFNEKKKTTEWISSDKVMLTFEGDTLPDYIKVYGLINMKVHPFIEPVRTCRKCWSYGHSQLKCQRMARCGFCGRKEHGEEPCSEKESSKCLHCKAEHNTFSSDCPQFGFQKAVQTYMSYNCVGFYQAQEVIRDKPEFSILKLRRNVDHATVRPTKEHFPKLKEANSKELLELKRIGGSGMPEVGNGVTLKNVPVRTYSKAVSLPLTSASKSPSHLKKKKETLSKEKVKQQLMKRAAEEIIFSNRDLEQPKRKKAPA